jgi:hypothetical protein
MSARRALLVVAMPGGGGEVRAGGSRAAGGGWEGRPAVLVWFLGWGRAGAPVVGLPAWPVGGLLVASLVRGVLGWWSNLGCPLDH